MLHWLPIGREAADVLAPLRLAERGTMPVFGAKSKTPMSKETPPTYVPTRTCVGKADGEEAKMGVVVVDVVVVVVKRSNKPNYTIIRSTHM